MISMFAPLTWFYSNPIPTTQADTSALDRTGQECYSIIVHDTLKFFLEKSSSKQYMIIFRQSLSWAHLKKDLLALEKYAANTSVQMIIKDWVPRIDQLKELHEIAKRVEVSLSKAKLLKQTSQILTHTKDLEAYQSFIKQKLDAGKSVLNAVMANSDIVKEINKVPGFHEVIRDFNEHWCGYALITDSGQYDFENSKLHVEVKEINNSEFQQLAETKDLQKAFQDEPCTKAVFTVEKVLSQNTAYFKLMKKYLAPEVYQCTLRCGVARYPLQDYDNEQYKKILAVLELSIHQINYQLFQIQLEKKKKIEENGGGGLLWSLLEKFGAANHYYLDDK